jgi:ribonuclease G
VEKDLIIDSSGSEVTIALLEDKKLVELHKEKNNKSYAVGDLYLGKVRKIVSGLNAAFIDVGYEKDAFLHYLDMGPQVKTLNKYVLHHLQGRNKPIKMENFKLEKDIEKSGKISQVLKGGQYVLAQVAKEPISAKGPKITTEIAIPGRYMVLLPFSNKVSISQKIKNFDNRNRLKRLMHSIKPNNYGLILRTAAETKKVAELDRELHDLIEKWQSAVARLAETKPPAKLFGDLDRSIAILRDILSESFNSIIVNDSELLSDIKEYVSRFSPGQESMVKLYKGKAPIMEHHGIEKQIKGSFGKKVTLANGAYLIIEHTEAFHVVDVNSGHHVDSAKDQEENALQVNLDMAEEVARQLRLRDMGGIIVIDFIDLRQGKNRRKLYEKMCDEMKSDAAKHTILPPSKFGLVQITRQRVRPETDVKTVEKCPSCGGTGEIKASILYVDEIENDLKYLVHEQNEKHITLSVHPYIFSHLTKGMFSKRWKWFRKYKKWVRIQSLTSHHLLEHHFFNQEKDEIKV